MLRASRNRGTGNNLKFENMKPTYLYLILFLLGCQNDTKKNTIDLINASIEAHGGMDNWNALKNISYVKRTVMYLPDGSIESEVTQKIKYVFKPKFSGKMRWEKDGVNYQIVFDGNASQLFLNGIEIQDSVLVANYFSEFMASYYVFAQPFKLLEDKANRTYEGETRLENGMPVDVVKVTYPKQNNERSDEWWYYFDTKTHRLAANMVHHKKGYSYIENTKYQSANSLLFNAERKSYNVDSLRNVQYLRANYFLTGLNIEM
ncbi:MAG: hypothetical protein CVT96_08125 [Bacteroidetes bacterium HGW-Bacteroidetes-13]|nr:MAG: hypothetical protein CVT96_08125 [Bacteroidetes bacterium HGW-Bacteroidetes-13]